MASLSISTGGFECEFLEKPPEKLIQSECPVCLQILREPHQAPCCGKSFCRVCIERIKTNNQSCPTCKGENLVTFHNKGLQCSLYEFQVYCSHKQEGCEWKGELGHLEKHLNLSPQPDKQLEGCEYSEIECIYCSELIKRSNIVAHQTKQCPKRPFNCEYCHNYESHYEDVVNNHQPECYFYAEQCPNECGTLLYREAIENHITQDCPNAIIDCNFTQFGCDVRLPRKDMPSHLQENLVIHMSLQAASQITLQDQVRLLRDENQAHKLTIANLQQTIKKLEDCVNITRTENELQKTTIANLRGTVTGLNQRVSDLQSKHEHLLQHAGIVPCTLVMEYYKKHKRDGDEWFSPPFCTHAGGYVFCMNVDVNGNGEGEGTHISVFFYLMKGKFDANLKWPFRGEITFQLLNQDHLEWSLMHRTLTVIYDDKTPNNYAKRVMRNDRSDDGWGNSQFIAHHDVTKSYHRNNCLHFRIKSVKVY